MDPKFYECPACGFLITQYAGAHIVAEDSRRNKEGA